MIQAINDVAAGWFAWQAAMLWQVAVLIGIVAAADWAMRRWAWPQVRYALWLLVFVKLVAPPTVGLSTSVTARVAAMVESRVRVEVVDRPGEEEMVGMLPAAKESATPLLEAGVNDGLGAGGDNDEGAVIAEADGMPTLTGAAAIRVPSREGAEVETEPAAKEAAASPLKAGVNDGAAGDTVQGVRLSWKAYLLIVWLAGVLVLSGWLVGRLRGFRREHLRGDSALPEGFGALMEGAARRLGLRRRVRVVLTDRVSGPAVFGVFRPVLLMPAERVGELTREELEHVLLHELAHVKRGDLAVHGAGMVLQIAYWFNPLLWVIRRPMQELRELCCDATVARVLRERTGGYRATLLETARRLVAEPAGPGMGLLGLFENSHRLVDRLKWLERESWRRTWLREAVVLLLVGVMLACVLPMANGEAEEQGEAAGAAMLEEFEGSKALEGDEAKSTSAEAAFIVQKVRSGSAEEPDVEAVGAALSAAGFDVSMVSMSEDDTIVALDLDSSAVSDRRNEDADLIWDLTSDTVEVAMAKEVRMGPLESRDAGSAAAEFLRQQAGLAADKPSSKMMKASGAETYLAVMTDQHVAYLVGAIKSSRRLSPLKRTDQSSPSLVWGKYLALDTSKESGIGRRPHPFSAVVGGGTTVALLGLCEIPGEGKAWWAADGGPVADVYWDGAHGREGERARQAVFRIHSDETDPELKPTVKLSVRRNSVGEGSWAGAFVVSKDRKTLEDLRGCSFSLHDDHPTAEIEATVGYGSWETQATRKVGPGTELSSIFTNVGTLIFHDPTTEDGKTILSATLLNQVKSSRLVAIDKHGKLHDSSSATSMGTKEADGPEYTIFRAEFSLVLSEIDRFEFQTRTYKTVTFKNVSLYAGVRTNVEVVGGDTSAEGQAAVYSPAKVNDPKYVSRITYERPASDLAADAFKDEQPFFGDTVGFAVNYHHDDVVHTIDFDTERIIQIPENLDIRDKEAVRLWARSEGVDAVIRWNGLTAVRMAASNIVNEEWTRLYPHTLEKLDSLSLDSDKAMGALSSGFAYYAFKTSGGRLGVLGLSVLWGSETTPRRLLIKYKLAKPEESALPEGSSKRNAG